jgi:cation:H+ antiporter
VTDAGGLFTLALIAGGIIALVAGGEAIVRGASRVSAMLGLPPVVIGLTVVAFGTSAPELAVGLQAAGAGQPDLVIGNVVGSNIYNVLLVLGLSALIAPLLVKQRLVRIDVPLMVGASIVFFVLALDGSIDLTEGLIMFGLLLGYVGLLLALARRESPDVVAEYEREYAPPPARGARAWLVNLGLLGLGLVLIVIGAGWLVEGAVTVARSLGISELVIGLTVVAIGTSLPELVTSLVAVIRDERDIAVGNIVGSNIFNLLCVLALTAVLAPDGVSVAAGALGLDIPFMLVIAVACLPIFFTGHVIARWEGALFLAYGIGYTVYLVLDATHHRALPAFELVALAVVPLTLVTLAVISLREIGRRRAA